MILIQLNRPSLIKAEIREDKNKLNENEKQNINSVLLIKIDLIYILSFIHIT